jgi:4-hydroxy-3-polyprenylbenzoate decarboxylase
MLDHLAVRILDQFHLDHPAANRWSGMKQALHQE